MDNAARPPTAAAGGTPSIAAQTLASFMESSASSSVAVPALSPSEAEKVTSLAKKFFHDPPSRPAVSTEALSSCLFQSFMEESSPPLTSITSTVEKLKRDGPRQVCQYQFRKNDIVWMCKTCQRDETCVICNECYHASNHDGHEIFFYHSQAGGCCDCGDADAWKPAGACCRHGRVTEDPMATVSPAILSVGKVLIPAVTGIMNECLSSFPTLYDPNNSSTALALASVDSENPKASLRWNFDEIHTKTEFLQAMRGVLHLPASTIEPNFDTQLARRGYFSAVGQFGQLLVYRNSLRSLGFSAAVMSAHQEERETAVILAMKWLISLCQINDGLCCMICTYGYPSFEPLAAIMKDAAHLSKPMLMALHDLMLAMMAYPPFKHVVSHAYVTTYRKCMAQYASGLGLKDINIFSFSVQFLNRPVVVHDLVQRHGLFGELSAAFVAMMASTADVKLTSQELHDQVVRGKPLQTIQSNLNSVVMKHRRYLHIAGDIRFLFEVKDISRAFCTLHLKEWLFVLLITMEMHAQKRQYGAHVQFESSDWMPAFNMTLNAVSLFGILNGWVNRSGGGEGEAPSEAGQAAAGASSTPIADFSDCNHEGNETPGRYYSMCILTQDSTLCGPQSIVDREERVKLMSAADFLLKCYKYMHYWSNFSQRGLQFPSKACAANASLQQLLGVSCRNKKIYLCPYGIEWTAADANISQVSETVGASAPTPPSIASCVDARQMIARPAPEYKSFHYPLHRFFASTLRRCCSWEHGRVAVGAVLRRIASDEIPERGLESLSLLFPLATLLWDCEITAGMWVLNGQSMHDQQHHYSEPPYCHHARDLDLLTVQLYAQHYANKDAIASSCVTNSDGERKQGKGVTQWQQHLIPSMFHKTSLVGFVCHLSPIAAASTASPSERGLDSAGLTDSNPRDVHGDGWVMLSPRSTGSGSFDGEATISGGSQDCDDFSSAGAGAGAATSMDIEPTEAPSGGARHIQPPPTLTPMREEPHRFIHTVRNRGANQDEVYACLEHGKSEHKIALLEQVLLTIIQLVTYLPLPPASATDLGSQRTRLRSMLRTHFIHFLAAAKTPADGSYGTLSGAALGCLPDYEEFETAIEKAKSDAVVGGSDDKKDSVTSLPCLLDEVLGEVATVTGCDGAATAGGAGASATASTGGGGGTSSGASSSAESSRYVLKDSCWAEYDPTYPYTRRNAHQRLIEERPTVTTAQPIVPPFKPSHDVFSNVRGYILGDLLLLHTVHVAMVAQAAASVPQSAATPNVDGGTASPEGERQTPQESAYKKLMSQCDFPSTAGLFQRAIHVLTLAFHQFSNITATASGDAAVDSAAPPRVRSARNLGDFLLRTPTIVVLKPSRASPGGKYGDVSQDEVVDMTLPSLLSTLLDLEASIGNNDKADGKSAQGAASGATAASASAGSGQDQNIKHWLQWLVAQCGSLGHEGVDLVLRQWTANSRAAKEAEEAAARAALMAKRRQAARDRAMNMMKGKAQQFQETLKVMEAADEEEERARKAKRKAAGVKKVPKRVVLGMSPVGRPEETAAEKEDEDEEDEEQDEDQLCIICRLRDEDADQGAADNSSGATGGSLTEEARAAKAETSTLAFMAFCHATRMGCYHVAPANGDEIEEDFNLTAVRCSSAKAAKSSSKKGSRYVPRLHVDGDNAELTDGDDSVDAGGGTGSGGEGGTEAFAAGDPDTPAPTRKRGLALSPNSPCLTSTSVESSTAPSLTAPNHHLSFCGHAIHLRCFDGYYARLVEESLGLGGALGSNYNALLYDVSKGQFLCPLCKKVNNRLVPDMRHVPDSAPQGGASVNGTGKGVGECDVDTGAAVPMDSSSRSCSDRGSGDDCELQQWYAWASAAPQDCKPLTEGVEDEAAKGTADESTLQGAEEDEEEKFDDGGGDDETFRLRTAAAAARMRQIQMEESASLNERESDSDDDSRGGSDEGVLRRRDLNPIDAETGAGAAADNAPVGRSASVTQAFSILDNLWRRLRGAGEGAEDDAQGGGNYDHSDHNSNSADGGSQSGGGRVRGRGGGPAGAGGAAGSRQTSDASRRETSRRRLNAPGGGGGDGDDDENAEDDDMYRSDSDASESSEYDVPGWDDLAAVRAERDAERAARGGQTGTSAGAVALPLSTLPPYASVVSRLFVRYFVEAHENYTVPSANTCVGAQHDIGTMRALNSVHSLAQVCSAAQEHINTVAFTLCMDEYSSGVAHHLVHGTGTGSGPSSVVPSAEASGQTTPKESEAAPTAATATSTSTSTASSKFDEFRQLPLVVDGLRAYFSACAGVEVPAALDSALHALVATGGATVTVSNDPSDAAEDPAPAPAPAPAVARLSVDFFGASCVVPVNDVAIRQHKAASEQDADTLWVSNRVNDAAAAASSGKESSRGDELSYPAVLLGLLDDRIDSVNAIAKIPQLIPGGDSGLCNKPQRVALLGCSMPKLLVAGLFIQQLPKAPASAPSGPADAQLSHSLLCWYRTVCVAALAQQVAAAVWRESRTHNTATCANTSTSASASGAEGTLAKMTHLVQLLATVCTDAAQKTPPDATKPLSSESVSEVLYQWCTVLRSLRHIWVRLVGGSGSCDAAMENGLREMQTHRMSRCPLAEPAGGGSSSSSSAASVAALFSPDSFMPSEVNSEGSRLISLYLNCCDVSFLMRDAALAGGGDAGVSVVVTLARKWFDGSSASIGLCAAAATSPLHSLPLTAPVPMLPLPTHYDVFHHSVITAMTKFSERFWSDGRRKPLSAAGTAFHWEASDAAGAVINSSGEPCEFPAVCMLCGAILNSGGKGMLHRHIRYSAWGSKAVAADTSASMASSCHGCPFSGGDVGVFFMVQSCSLLLCYGPRTITHPAPYADVHGDKHHGHRGRPLFLEKDRMQVLQRMYSSCNIPREVIQKRCCLPQMIINGYY